MGFSGYFKFLLDVSGYSGSLTDAGKYLILVEFSGILRSVESGGFLKYKIDINGNFSGFSRFWVEVRAVYYKAFLLTTGGGK